MKTFDFLKFPTIIENKTLILGETGVGKTLVTTNFLIYLIHDLNIEPKEVSLLDFAPPQKTHGDLKLGGTIEEILISHPNFLAKANRSNNSDIQKILKKINHIKSSTGENIQTPRFSASNSQEVLCACLKNFEITIDILQQYLKHPSKYLIINDLGIYLHMGSPLIVKEALKISKTVLMNAYMGNNLLDDKGSNISIREKHLLKKFEKVCKIVQI
jgi:hypothetical protein